jgi:hypothetical protein
MKKEEYEIIKRCYELYGDIITLGMEYDELPNYLKEKS